MDNQIIDYISQFITLSEEEVQVIARQNLFKQYSKNEILLSEGAIAKDCYFIIRGCVRSYRDILLALPIAAYEMTLAGWLIAKGVKA